MEKEREGGGGGREKLDRDRERMKERERERERKRERERERESERETGREVNIYFPGATLGFFYFYFLKGKNVCRPQLPSACRFCSCSFSPAQVHKCSLNVCTNSCVVHLSAG